MSSATFIYCPGCEAVVEYNRPVCPGCGHCIGCGRNRNGDVATTENAPSTKNWVSAWFGNSSNERRCFKCNLPYCKCCGRCPKCLALQFSEITTPCECGHPNNQEILQSLLEHEVVP